MDIYETIHDVMDDGRYEKALSMLKTTPKDLKRIILESKIKLIQQYGIFEQEDSHDLQTILTSDIEETELRLLLEIIYCKYLLRTPDLKEPGEKLYNKLKNEIGKETFNPDIPYLFTFNHVMREFFLANLYFQTMNTWNAWTPELENDLLTALDYFSDIKNIRLQIATLSSLITISTYEKPEETLEYIDRAILLGESHNLNFQLLEIYQSSMQFLVMSNSTKVADFLKFQMDLAIPLSTELGDPMILYRAHEVFTYSNVDQELQLAHLTAIGLLIDKFPEHEGLQRSKFWYLQNIAGMHFDMGDVHSANKFYEQSSQEVSLQKNDSISLFGYYNNVGMFYSHIGKMDKAIDYLEQAIKLSEGFLVLKGLALQNLVETLRKRGNYQLALEKLDQIENTDSDGSSESLDNLFEYFYLHLLLGEKEKSYEYLQLIDDVFTKDSKRSNEYVYKKVHAVNYQYSSRFSDKSKAQELLKDILVNFTEFEIFLISDLLTLNLIEEYSISKDPKIIDEIESIVNDKIKKATKSGRFLWKVDAEILKSRIMVVRGDLLDAVNLLDDLAKECEQLGIINKLQLIMDEKEKLLNTLSSWKEVLDSNKQLTVLVEKSGLSDYIKMVLNYKEENIANT